MESSVASPDAEYVSVNSTWHILLASLIGTTIEFFDFYIYATAAVLVFPALFFPKSSHGSAVLESLATFALAFFARPIGSALFGHFGDRIGRKATLVAALLTMGISTVIIGILPTYATIGIGASALLALCRLGQGLGLGGEWGGAVLLATENAPPGKRAWFGMFPQLGAPIGFLFATLVFLALTHFLNDAQFLAFGWRIPFLCSAVLIAIGLWVRLKITETPEFQRVLDHDERERVPMVTIFKKHPVAVLSGTFAMLATFVLFYLMTVFTLSWGTSKLGYAREQFLLLQMVSVVFFGIFIPIGAIYAGRIGTRRMMIVATIIIGIFGLAFAPLFASHSPWAVLAFLSIGMILMGLTYGPCGTLLAEMFPAKVRYTGASISFNLAGIFGASLAPYIATKLASNYGLAAVGGYMCIAAIITLGALLAVRLNVEPSEVLESAKPTSSVDGIIPEA
jgi:metabolite-proton symporter